MSAEIARLATVEARWFGDGPLTADLVAWFEEAGDVAVEPPRTDRYLRLPGVEGVGVKWRAGASRSRPATGGTAGAGGLAADAGAARGLAQMVRAARPTGADTPPPLDVAKTRRLVARGGVQVELAALEMAGRRFWTFGLEGARAGDVEAVLATAWAAAAPRARVTFAGGYPAWLDRCAPG